MYNTNFRFPDDDEKESKVIIKDDNGVSAHIRIEDSSAICRTKSCVWILIEILVEIKGIK